MEGINLEGFLRANESQIRWRAESLVLEQVTRAIGRDNLEKVTLIFEGSALDDLAVRETPTVRDGCSDHRLSGPRQWRRR